MNGHRLGDAASQWWNRRMVLGGVGASIGSVWLGGCGISSKPETDNAHQQSTGQPDSVLVNVRNTTVGKISAGFTGLSYEKDSLALRRFSSEHLDFAGLFRRLGSGVLRIGGDSVDQTRWVANGAGRTIGEVAPPDVDGLADFLKSTGWRCLYGVNLATSTPAFAADEVSYVVRALGSSLYGIEIGNECEVYGFSNYPMRNGWDLKRFEALWGQFRAAILQSNPGVMVTGPGAGSNVRRWTVPFAQDLGNHQIGLITQHYYRGDGRKATATVDNLLSPDSDLKAELSVLNSCAERLGVPFRITETNSFAYGGAPGTSNTYASALWVIDHLFTIALGGGAGANLHGGGDDSDEYYAPIVDHNGVVVDVRPEYYGILLFTLAGNGGLLDTRVSAHQLNVTAYSVRVSKDELRVVIVNKDRTRNIQVSIDCGRSVHSASLLAMRATGLDSTTGVTIQRAAVQRDGTFSPEGTVPLPVADSRITCHVDALNCALISVSIAS